MKWRNREMKNFMKLGAVVLAIVMVLSMSVTAFAEGEATLSSGGVAGSVANDNTATALSKSVNISKSIKALNPNSESTSIAAPSITYSYTIAPVTFGENVTRTINDGDTTVNVKPGVTGATITESLSWASTEDINASSTGIDSTKTITANFTNVNFTAAGVYRYVITETVAAGAYAAAGVTDGDSGDTNTAATANTRYLDVYVKDGSNGAFDIYGYVLSTAEGNITSTDTSTKTNSFTTDLYKTENVTVSKTLNGDQYNNDHDFPFSVSFANTTVTAGSEIKVLSSENGGTASAGSDLANTAANNGAWSHTPSIDSGSSVTYVGIPSGTTVTVYETNDVTGTVYQSTFTVDGNTVQNSSKSITWSSDNNANKSVEATVTTGDAANNHTIAFTNTLELISPTGVVLRVAPYALMLGVGLFLVLFMRRRKNRAEA